MDSSKMLLVVQEIKEQCIIDMIKNNNSKIGEKQAKQFLNDNWIQILDMLDDALYAYQNGNDLKPRK